MVDSAGNAYVMGETFSTDFPSSTGAFHSSNVCPVAYSANAFVTKLNAEGSAVVYSTYLGSSAEQLAPAVLPWNPRGMPIYKGTH